MHQLEKSLSVIAFKPQKNWNLLIINLFSFSANSRRNLFCSFWTNCSPILSRRDRICFSTIPVARRCLPMPADSRRWPILAPKICNFRRKSFERKMLLHGWLKLKKVLAKSFDVEANLSNNYIDTDDQVYQIYHYCIVLIDVSKEVNGELY